MKDYDNKCYKASSTTRRNDYTWNNMWRFSEVPVKKNTPKKNIKVQTNNDLFDIGKNMDQLTGNKEKYYNDQCTKCIGRLSEEVD